MEGRNRRRRGRDALLHDHVVEAARVEHRAQRDGDARLAVQRGQLSSQTFWCFAREFSSFSAVTGDYVRYQRLRAEWR
jgi:hypothetical protein